ncbi:MAG: glycosyltransferase family 39 protein [Vicinamibacterales bacterium]|nr:glycosyltransferase family 39 protein [Vicinamibacterales bacterium]
MMIARDSRALAIDASLAAGLAALTVGCAVALAPLGFNAGFVDMAHDGYQLRQALDLSGGGVVFRDTFDQYGPLTPYLNLLGFSVFGERLLAIKHFVAVWYGLTAVVLFVLARHYLNRVLSVAVVILWVLTAPFYQHGVMLSPHAYAIAFQAVAMIWLIRGDGRWPPVASLAVVGLLCGVGWMLKQSVGALFVVAVAGFIATEALLARNVRLGALRLAGLGAGFGLVIVGTLLWLEWQGASADWYRQTMLFPPEFYLRTMTTFNSPWLEALDTFVRVQWNAEPFWHVWRLIVIGGALAAVRSGRSDPKLVLAGWVTALSWLAAFPSGNFMHQWWTISPTLCAGVYVVSRGWTRLFGGASPRARAAVTLATLAVFVALVWTPVEARVTDAWARHQLLGETLQEPRTLSGIRTDAATHEGITTMYRAAAEYRVQHPRVPIVSIDSSDGHRTGVAQSLPVLSFFEDRTHPEPVYWSLPALSTVVYPEYAGVMSAYVRDTGALIVDFLPGGTAPRDVRGYRVLSTSTLRDGQLSLYAPDPAGTAGESVYEIMAGADRHRRLPQFEPIIRWIPDVATGRLRVGMLYAWPLGTPFPQEVPMPMALPPDGVDILAPIVSSADGGWRVDGHPDAPMTYLVKARPTTRLAGERFVATGVVFDGGLTLGFVRDDRWVGYTNIDRVGWFVVSLTVPDDGDYEIVLANNLRVQPSLWDPVVDALGLRAWFPAPSLTNDFWVQQAGWVVPGGSVEP